MGPAGDPVRRGRLARLGGVSHDGAEVSTIGLVLHPTRPVDGSVDTITTWARTQSVRVLARERDRHRVSAEVEIVPDAEFVGAVDGVVALGGDGTMLGAMRLVIDRPVPVLGVNHGHLGFLVEIVPQTLASALEQLVSATSRSNRTVAWWPGRTARTS
jgi:NAD+ kinase